MKRRHGNACERFSSTSCKDCFARFPAAIASTPRNGRTRESSDNIHSLSDFQNLPFTYKSELVRAQEEAPPFGTNATFSLDAYTRVHQTSGTTGIPIRVVDTPESWDWWGHCWGHVLTGAGVTAADRVFLPFSFGPFIGFWATVEGAKRVGAMMIPGGGWDSIQRL